MNKLPLYDAIVTGNISQTARIRFDASKIRNAIVFDVNNVVQLYEKTGMDPWNMSDFDGGLPPFPFCFLEWDGSPLRYRSGCFAYTLDRDAPESEFEREQWDALLAKAQFNAEPRWVVGLHPWLLWRNKEALAAPSEILVAMNDAAKVVDVVMVTLGHDAFKNFDKDKAMNWCAWVYHAAMFVFTLANCKNVGRIERDGIAIKKRVNRAPSKWKYKYRVLTISPIGKATSGAVEGESEGSISMHFCRGNFARYTEEKPLFGKYVGTYWRPAHLKGNVKVGVVDKDYAVKPA